MTSNAGGAVGVDSSLKRVINGDRDEADAFIRQHYGYVKQVVSRIIRDQSNVDDVVQNAFIMALRGLKNFRGESKVKTWIHRIAVNAALMDLRKRQTPTYGQVDDLMPRFNFLGMHKDRYSDWCEPAEKVVQRKELVELVHQEIKKLPHKLQEVLIARDVEHMNTTETAMLLDISEAAVKTRLHRGRAALRALLDSVMKGGK